MEKKESLIPKVYSIFANFFGEERVDLQNYNIIVHFPKVTVTNDFDRSIDITGLWVKVAVNEDGTIEGSFRMIRNEYTKEQFICGYCHSHVPVRTNRNYLQWASPCLGSGPIINTIASLATNYNEEIWTMFCLELSKYVTVESLLGCPYIRFETIDSPRHKIKILPNIEIIESIPKLTPTIPKEFIEYILLKKPFKFAYAGSYSIAASPYEIIIILSNLFIEWYNSLSASEQSILGDLDKFIFKGKFIKGYLYTHYDSDGNGIPSITQFVDMEVLKFKGDSIKFKIIKSFSKDQNIVTLLNKGYIVYIINKLINIINYRYGKAERGSTREVFLNL